MSNWAFIEHATAHLQRPRMGDPRAPTLWPSEATATIVNEYDETVVVGKCRRATYFRYLLDNYRFYYHEGKYNHYAPLVEELRREQLPPDKYMIWIWRAGELYEEYLINLAKESGVFVAEQVSMYIRDINLAGKIDIVIINPETHKYSNTEVKSVYGFGGNVVLGTPGARRDGKLGSPRESNLMQIALYDWQHASKDSMYEESRLVYGARDTGRYAEYLVKTYEQEDNTVNIFYKGNAPNETNWIKSPITINSVVKCYQETQRNLDSGVIPERDFDLQYSEEKITTLYNRGLLSKTDKERHEKRQKFLSGESKRPIKPVIKGDWQCNLCKFKNICYSANNKPREL